MQLFGGGYNLEEYIVDIIEFYHYKNTCTDGDDKQVILDDDYVFQYKMMRVSDNKNKPPRNVSIVNSNV